jgi:hypothetical protein
LFNITGKEDRRSAAQIADQYAFLSIEDEIGATDHRGSLLKCKARHLAAAESRTTEDTKGWWEIEIRELAMVKRAWEAPPPPISLNLESGVNPIPGRKRQRAKDL